MYTQYKYDVNPSTKRIFFFIKVKALGYYSLKKWEKSCEMLYFETPNPGQMVYRINY